ncbi:hypothetical protein DBT54_07170 [Aerococcus loyolae]|uniref:Serine aminopeptidase S33 domain-containing protein n=2 Tax=Aerococcaceae TaxID=186827 RepID=A0A329P0F1_9LACT|nr:hypothetical protein DBT54_07170 [Aerococcus loyolae]
MSILERSGTSMQKQESFYFTGDNEVAVLLFHAYTGTTADVRMTGRALNREGYTVYCHNLTGHGTGRVEDILAAEPSDWIADARQALAFIKSQGYEKLAVFGLSLGGSIATKLFIEEESQFIAAGSFCTPIMTTNIEETNVGKAFMAMARNVKVKEGFSGESLKAELRGIDSDLSLSLEKINRFNNSMHSQLGTITKPYFIAEAGQDELVGDSSGRLLKEAMPNAQVTLAHFEDSGHVITVGKAHQAFEQALIEFLNQVV